MKTYITQKYPNGLRVPYSGFFLYKLVEGMCLKSIFGDSTKACVTSKMFYRYAKAVEPMEYEKVKDVIATIVDHLVPEHIVIGRHGLALRMLMKNSFKHYMADWDKMAFDVNKHMFRVEDMRDFSMIFCRFVALDIGLRLGAWSSLQLFRGNPQTKEQLHYWFEGEGLSHFIEERKKACGYKNYYDLARNVNVSEQRIYEWKSKKHIPSNKNIQALAEALANETMDTSEVNFRLRVLIGVNYAIDQISSLLGADYWEDIVSAIVQTAEQIQSIHKDVLLFSQEEGSDFVPPEHGPDALWIMLIHGAHCEMAKHMCIGLQQKAIYKKETQEDIWALCRGWSNRILYYLRHTGSIPEQKDFLLQHRPPGCSEEQAKMIFDVILNQYLCFGNIYQDFDWDDVQMEKVSLPPFVQAMHLQYLARMDAERLNFQEAIRRLSLAMKDCPDNAGIHFDLGCYLWQFGEQKKDVSLFHRGLEHCHVAIKLDPDFGNARNEIAIILSNLRQHEKAELLFGEAEPYFGDHNHHWLCRGKNYLALKRYEDALQAFDRGLKCITASDPKKKIELLLRKAVTLRILGKKGKAKRLGREIEQLWGHNPVENWKKYIDPWDKYFIPKI